jgi:hypothetical protein
MISEAILKINPNAIVNVRGEDIDTCEIEWLEGTAEISKADIKAKMVELQADYDAKQYQRDRIYPSLQDQLDMQYWDGINNTTTWKDAITKVKTDNPKS